MLDMPIELTIKEFKIWPDLQIYCTSKLRKKNQNLMPKCALFFL